VISWWKYYKFAQLRLIIGGLIAPGLLLLSACGGDVSKPKARPQQQILNPTNFMQLSGWKGQDHGLALAAFKRSCERFDTFPKGYMFSYPGGSVDQWRGACAAAKSTPVSQGKKFFEKYFTPYEVTNNGKKNGLFTGYYEIELTGSITPDERYRYPLYKLPPQLRYPFLGRRRIDSELELEGKGLELVYVDDPVELFFLHIQGSGRVRLADGSVMRVGYAGKNGCPYRSIGGYLIREGEMTRAEVTAPAIKQWLRDNPDKAQAVMNTNQSYVFFREVKGKDGPIGAQGVALTPEGSIAIDPAFIPYGMPVWLDTTIPKTKEYGAEHSYQRLLIAQDTGGVIRGVVRGDVFFGYGHRAAVLAGHMKQQGSYYLLIPNTVSP